MRAHQIMTRSVIVLGADASVVDAARLMLDNHVSGLPVLDKDGKLIGIVSEGDFLRRVEIGTQRRRPRWLQYFIGPSRAANEFVHASGRKVEEIMTPQPKTVRPDQLVSEALELLNASNITALMVVDAGSPVGIVHFHDLLRAGVA